VSEGGLFITLAESAMQSSKGFDVCTDANFRKDAWLFGEAQGRVVISISPEAKVDFEAHFAGMQVPVLQIGTVKGDDMVIDGNSFGTVNGVRSSYDNALAARLG
jgi:phosphoribosylformylglycinamidine synthase